MKQPLSKGLESCLHCQSFSLLTFMPSQIIIEEMSKHSFPFFHRVEHQDLIYLDNAATTQKPQSVLDTLQEFYTSANGNVHRSLHGVSQQSTEWVEKVRKQIARSIKANQPEEIIFTASTTSSLNMVAWGIGLSHLQAGDEVLLSIMEHHSQLLPWQQVCRRQGATLRFIPITARGDLDMDALSQMLNKHTKVVAILHASNVLGSVVDIFSLVKQAHAYGAKVVVDAAQTVAHMPLDVQSLACDFLAFSGHKCYGPTGIGILYGKKEELEKLSPLLWGGGMVEHVTQNEVMLSRLPHRLEAGTPPIAQIAGLGAAFEYIEKIGYASIVAHEKQLLAYAEEGLRSIPGVKVWGTPEKRIGILSFSLAGWHPLDVGVQLSLKQIALRTGHHCAQPLIKSLDDQGSIRLSLAMYNTQEDIETLLEEVSYIASKTTR